MRCDFEPEMMSVHHQAINPEPKFKRYVVCEIQLTLTYVCFLVYLTYAKFSSCEQLIRCLTPVNS